MSETKHSPKALWNNALKAVKGDTTTELVERFTSEMTLVAEGLVDDMSQLQHQLAELEKEQDKTSQKLQTSTDALESSLLQNQRDLENRIAEINARINSMEHQLQTPKSKSPKTLDKAWMIRQLTWIIALVCGTVIFTSIIRLFT